VEVDATGRWGEGGCTIPGEICSSASGLIASRDGMMGEQKSAEGIVVTAHGDEGPNEKERLGTELRWMKETQTGWLRGQRPTGR
jgi:hypothetical protein